MRKLKRLLCFWRLKMIILIFVHSHITTAAANSTSILPESLEEKFVKHGALPPPSYDSLQNLQRPSRLEDFMWTGSGEGPNSSDQDGGLAWEDNIPAGGGVSDVIRVTKTMVLYRTVLTTIYPVEMTPTVVIVSLSSTPRLFPSPSFPPDSSGVPEFPSSQSSGIIIQPSSSSDYNLQTSILDVTTFEPNTEKTSETTGNEHVPTPVPESQPEMPPSTDLVYQVKTIIKANTSEIESLPYFHKTMQKSLARVYASAFKRHLLTSLGVLNKTQLSQDENALRRKRQSQHSSEQLQQSEHFDSKEDLDVVWMFLGQHMTPNRLKQLATTSMNVSVTILNISAEHTIPQMIMKYIVCAEGSPIPAASAVQDLQLISKREMEDEIGYEVINKAEALMGGNLPVSQVSTSGTSPWLILSITTICLMVVLILIIMYMVWKWKHNRLGDTSPRPRPQSGIEEGVVNPVFLGPPSRTGQGQEVHHRERSQKERTGGKSTYSTHRKIDDEDEIYLKNASTRYRTDSRRQQQEALASELSSRLVGNEDNVSPSSIKGGDKSSTEKQESSGDSAQLIKLPTSPRHSTKGHRTKSKKSRSYTPSPKKTIRNAGENQRRKRRRTGVVNIKRKEDDENAEESSELSEKTSEEKSEEKGEKMFPDKFEICTLDEHLQESGSKSMDKISYEHLDVCPDIIARTPSDQARKVIMQGKSGGTQGQSSLGVYNSVEQRERRRKKRTQGMKFPETIDEISDIQSEDGVEFSHEEQDRELSERSFEPPESALSEPPMKDAQVQTPTKMSVRPKPKPRSRSRKPRTGKQSSESLISTESEEIIEFHHIDSSSGESNPLGRMRKRFHQFLDDAFNVMVSGKKEDDVEDGRAKSAKVSISHHVETQDARPWTSHVIREESVHRLRPKSATTIGPPKRAWTAGSERRCHSAKSESADKNSDIFDGESNSNFEPDECDATSTIFSERTFGERLVPSSVGNRSSVVSPVPIFPRYPIYPDIPVETVETTNRVLASTSRQQNDPAVPLIQAIKDEIQRFEKTKVTSSQIQGHLPPS